jgi:hypothetical protein
LLTAAPYVEQYPAALFAELEDMLVGWKRRDLKAGCMGTFSRCIVGWKVVGLT